MSLVLLAPYLLFVIPMAALNANPNTTFLLRLVGLALLGSALVETVALWLAPPAQNWVPGLRRANAHPKLHLIAGGVAVASMVADLIGARLGRGTVFTQVQGSLPDSTVAGLTALLSGWAPLAVGLLLAGCLGGLLSRRSLYLWLAALLVTQLLVAVMTARSAPLLGFICFIAAAGAICSVVHVRHLVVVIVLLVLGWPAMFELRNEIRQSGGVGVSEKVTADGRLRLDLQISGLAGYRVPVDIPQPAPLDYLRYGALPRVLDSDRPTLSTGVQINQFLGGGPTSAYNFLALGNIYLFGGPTGVILFHASWAALVAFLLRWRRGPGPMRLSLLCLALAGPLLWSSTYPDSMISFVQHSVSALPVFLLIQLTRART